MMRLSHQFSDGLSILLDTHQGQHAFDDTSPSFFTHEGLDAFWTDKKIRLAFCSYRGYDNAPMEVPDRIRSRFLRLFSLLVWIGRLDTIEDSFIKCSLTDDKFPLLEFPTAWRDTQQRRELYAKIAEEQWKFFPFIFGKHQLFNQELSSRHIIPINKVEKVQKSAEATVELIFVESCCVVDLGLQGPAPVAFVRKQYVGEGHQAVFSRERRAYEALCQYKSPHIVPYFGSFSQGRGDGKTAYNLILEHVDAGNLEGFYSDCPPPNNKTELVQFWTSFTGTLKGLIMIHQTIMQSDTNEFNTQIVHQDIKPSNFLVYREPQAALHDFSPILIDFGYSFTHVHVPSEHRNSGIKDLGGGQTYGAPESSHHEDFTQNDLNNITAAVDVWSLGCVLSEACVWLVRGRKGLEAYERRRTREIHRHAKLRSAGHSGCFHDGYKMLQEVARTHEKILDCLPAYDNITPYVIRMVEGAMLLPNGNARDGPYALFEQLQSFVGNSLAQRDHVSADTFSLKSLSINNANQNPALQQPSELPLASLRMSSNHVKTPSTSAQSVSKDTATCDRNLRLSYREADEFLQCERRNATVEKRVADTMKSLRESLRDRDFVYFIDNSTSMKEHRSEAREAIRVYASIATLIDTNGIEASFASNPKSVKRTKSSKSLLKTFDKQEWSQVTFEDRFSNFIDENIIPRLPAYWKRGPLRPKRISIFVLTDGMWGRGMAKACGIERPIQKLIQKMKEPSVQASRTQISIQFMRFGDDEDGMRYLDYLDHLGKGQDMDIVDTKRYDSDVCAILIGPIDQKMDEDGE